MHLACGPANSAPLTLTDPRGGALWRRAAPGIARVKPRLFCVIAWLLLAFLLGLQLYARQFDGWGRWVMAPLFLLPVIASAALVVIGIAICRREASAGQALAATATATLGAAVPALWFLAQVLAG